MMWMLRGIVLGFLLGAGINASLLEGAPWGAGGGTLEAEAPGEMVAPFKLALRAPEDDAQTEQETRRPGPAPKGVVSEPGEAEFDQGPPEKVGPQRDFVPSETIPADQAVDFPADI
jgi:hypothetical protein